MYIFRLLVRRVNYGGQYSTNIEKDINSINKLVAHYQVLNVDKKTAFVYGIIKAELRSKGKPIPENDIWIASIAKQQDLTLITRDKHFSEIESIDLETW